MPLSASRDRDFRNLTGTTVPTPSGAALFGTAPAVVAGGADFVSNGAASYFRETFTADSDHGQLTVDFILTGTPTGNKEVFLLGGAGAILTSPYITTGRVLWLRDASASGTGIAGWVPPTLEVGVPYRLKQAITKGATTSTGRMKAQLVRLTDGAVLASGLADGNANTGAVQTNGALAGIRTTAGNATMRVLSYRVSNQAFDYLEDIPAPVPPETPEPGVNALAFVGESTTDRGGIGAQQVKAAILANGQGWTSPRVQVDGLTSRTINFENGVHPTGLEQIDVFRQAGFDAGTWAFALGGNGAGSDLAQQITWFGQLLSKVAEGPLPAYRVILFGITRQDPANADAARIWQAIQQVVPPSKVTLTRVDFNSLLHNGRDESGFWQSTSPTEAHMTPAGYAVRDAIMAPFITAPETAQTTDRRLRALADTIGKALKALRNALPTQTSGLYAARPAASAVMAGSTYYATDAQEQYLALGTKGQAATSWLVLPAGGTELAYAQTTSSQTIPVQTTNNTPVDITGLVVSVVMPERPVEVSAQLIGRFPVQTGQDGTFQIRDAETNGNLNEAHCGYSTTTSEYKSLRWGARVIGTPGTTRSFKVVGMGKANGVLYMDASPNFPAFITVRSL